MSYRKVFSKARFQTNSPNSFHIEYGTKRVLVGVRNSYSRIAFLGKVIEQGKTSTILDYGVFCDIGFPHVIGVFGSRGSGKSFDLGVFLEEIYGSTITENGPITEDAGIVFDIQDQFWTLKYPLNQNDPGDQRQMSELKRWRLETQLISDVSILVPTNSETQVPDAIPFSLAASQISEDDYLAILELERFSPMGQALLTLLHSTEEHTPDRLAACCKANANLYNYQQSTIDGLRWRLESLAEMQIIAPQGLEVDEILKPGHLSIVLMRNTPDGVRALIVGVISRLAADKMSRAQQARKVQRRTGRTNGAQSTQIAQKLWMILDEAHVLIPSDEVTPATGPLIDYVKRGRDAGLSLIFATQQPSAVNTKLMSQVDMTLTHMLGFENDVSAAINRMPTRNTVTYEIQNVRASSLGDVIRTLDPGEAVLADGASGRIVLIKVRPRRTAHGGNEPQ